MNTRWPEVVIFWSRTELNPQFRKKAFIEGGWEYAGFLMESTPIIDIGHRSFPFEEEIEEQNYGSGHPKDRIF